MLPAPTPAAILVGLAVYRFGSGEPLFFMPGPHRFQRPGLRSADELITGLTGIGRQVVTYDPPGSGMSRRPAHLSMAEMMQCSDEALSVCQAAEAAVDALGHSMGGLTLLAYAIQNPQRVRRLILVGTGSGGEAYLQAPDALWNSSHPGFYRMALLGLLHIAWPFLGPQKLMNNYIERQSFYDCRFSQPTKIYPGDWLRPRSGRTDWHRIASKLDYSSRLGEIRAPTLILCGRHDPQYPPAASQQLAEGIPNARLVWFERSGHYPFIEEADKFWTTVREFLERTG